MAQVRLIDQFKVKPRCRTQLNNRGQVEREDKTILYLAECPGCAGNDRFYAIFFAGAFFLGLQANKDNTGVLPLSAKAKTIHGKDGFNVGFFLVQIVVLNLIQHLLRTRLRRASR